VLHRARSYLDLLDFSLNQGFDDGAQIWAAQFRKEKFALLPVGFDNAAVLRRIKFQVVTLSRGDDRPRVRDCGSASSAAILFFIRKRCHF